MHEIHDIGLLYINYEIVCAGYQSIFLGQSVPIDSLVDITNFYDTIVFGSYFTVKPEVEELNNYLKSFEEQLLKNTNNKLFALGRRLENYDHQYNHPQVTLYKSIDHFVKDL